MSEPLRPGSAVAPTAAHPSRPSHAFAALTLSLLMGLQPIATDLYLPALPALTRDLAAPMGAAQLTMSALILAFGVAQLVWGPVADRVGRRPVLLLGVALYTAAGIGGALAPSIGALIGWRVLQGAGVAAAVVCARAMLRDLYEPHEGARVMALALSGLALVAMTAPLLGGVLVAAWGWRAALAAVAVCAALTLVFVAFKVPETAPHKNPRATQAGPLFAAWFGIAQHRVFLAWALLIACSYGGLFTFLAASSFAFMDVLGLSATTYGLAMSTASVAYLAGTSTCPRWVQRWGMAGTVQRGALFSLAGGLLMAGLALAGVQSIWAILVPQWLYAFGHGMHQPCGQAGAVGPFPQKAGAASALAGFMLALTAFVVGLWLGSAMDGTVRPMALSIGICSILTCTVAWTLVRRIEMPGASA